MADEENETAAPFIVRLILCIILPPLGVFLKHGIKVPFWICLILCFIGWLPGIVYALLEI